MHVVCRLSLVPQLTFTSNKDQFRRGSLDSTDNGQEPKQVGRHLLEISVLSTRSFRDNVKSL